MAQLTRRQFLVGSVAASLVLGLDRLAFAGPLRPDRAKPPLYTDWRDVYRKRWTWDRVARGTHTNVNCVSSCAWNLYVRDGIVWREEQSSPYVASNASVPDFNPRGCNKGACASDLLTGPSRILHPMKRVGPRGGGRWKRISWDEALGEIAREMVDALAARGGEGMVCELGPEVDFGPNTVAAMRFFRQVGAPITDSMGQIGDLPIGGTITLGLPHTEGSSDDWFRSDCIVLWAFNPSVTRIPDAHFLNEARYRGAKIVSIAPDWNQSSLHADLWLPVKPGSDAALALAACQVVVAEGLHDADYLREQTDLPFLVRSDDGRFLRESDLKAGGSDSVFAVWDEARGRVVLAPGSQGSTNPSLTFPAGVKPALETKQTVKLASGKSVAVRTVFAQLRERLARDHTPEQAAPVTGVSATAIRRFARTFARSKAALILSQYGSCKNYHSDLIQRSQILLASLTGNLGRAGGGWRSGAYIALDGMGLLAMQEKLDLPHLALLAAKAKLDPEGVRRAFESVYVPSTLFHAVHGGLGESLEARNGDPKLADGTGPYLKKALDAGWFPMAPKPGAESPRVILSIMGNVLRHSRMGDRIKDTLFAKAKLIVDVNFRISETGRNADILLPAAGWYEKIGIKYVVSFVPYVTLGDRAVQPLGDAKPEWEIFARLAERVGAEATRRGVGITRGFNGEDCDLARLGERFSDGGRFGPEAQEEALAFVLKLSSATKGIDLAKLRAEGGAVRLASLGPQGGTAGIFSEYSQSEPVVPLRDFVEKKQPYPTLTGRQQFYVDHPWFLELGEELPTHKEPPAVGGDHPMTMTGGHARWSVHAMWRDQGLMLRLQRGEPVVYLNAADARQRGIRDHDLVRVRNDLSAFVARAKPSGAIRPGQVHIFHAWEPYQFRGFATHQHLAASPLKVTQLVGDYGHLKWGYAHYEPNQTDRDTRVEVERVEGLA